MFSQARNAGERARAPHMRRDFFDPIVESQARHDGSALRTTPTGRAGTTSLRPSARVSAREQVRRARVYPDRSATLQLRAVASGSAVTGVCVGGYPVNIDADGSLCADAPKQPHQQAQVLL